MRTQMSDEQTWAILTAPDELNARQLADRLGLTYSAVHHRRWQLRKHGWTCQVHWEPCSECGKPLIQRRRRQLYHDHCRPEVTRRLNASYEPSRQERITEEQLKARDVRRDAHYERAQAATRPLAANHMRRYSPEDDEVLLELTKTMTHEQIALEAGRTRAAVQTRLKVVKEQKRAIEPTTLSDDSQDLRGNKK